MCVIMAFAPGAMMNKTMFFNAVYNNWHGYGLILRDANEKIELIKGYDENGTDPEVLWELLEKNIDIERYLHVRHSTKGSTDLDNVQPFSVYNSNTRQVFFMHNGTLTGFGESGGVGKSDTVDFCEKILAPSLLSWWGPEGKADYTDVIYQKLLVEKSFSYGNTGLFVSNDLPPYRLGNGWSVFTHPVDPESQGEIWVSNKTYFDRLQRGPRFQKLEEARRAAEARAKALEESKKAAASNGNKTTEQKDQRWSDLSGSDLLEDYSGYNSGGYGWDETPFKGGHTVMTQNPVKKFDDNKCAKDPMIIKAMNTVINTWDLEDPKNLINLSNITYEEWCEFCQEDVDNGLFTVACLIEHFVSQYRKLAIRAASLSHKHQNAEKRLQEISLEKKTGIESGAKNVG